MVARVIALVNNKGGVTKTTSTVNLGYGLARAGRRVLIVDEDAQSNSTYAILQRFAVGPKGTMYQVLMEDRPLHEIIKPTDHPNLFIAPSSLWLEQAGAALYSKDMRERKLRNALKPYLSKFDYILIDTPPNLNVLTINALLACTDIIFPILLNGFALVGISIVLNAIKTLRSAAAANDIYAPMAILGVIVALARDTKEADIHLKAVKETFGELVIEPSVPLNVSIEMANSRLGSLYDLYPESTGARAYEQIVTVVDARIQQSALDLPAYHQKTDAILAKLPDLSAQEQEEF